jgi:hypothetical protein
MTNTTSKQDIKRNSQSKRLSDEAPMVVTRLSGWIGSNEAKPLAAWIVPTRLS